MNEKGVAGEVNMAALEADEKEVEFENAVLSKYVAKYFEGQYTYRLYL